LSTAAFIEARRDERVEIAMLLQHFQAERSLARDHGLVIERMNEGEAILFRATNRFLAGLVVIRASQDHFRAITARRRNFYQRRGQRHADLRFDSALRRVIRHSLRVIARGRRDHAAPPLFFGEQQNLVERAAFLERAGHLQIFQLQENRASRLLRKFLRVDERRNHD
jgi:hypothetical protein